MTGLRSLLLGALVLLAACSDSGDVDPGADATSPVTTGPSVSPSPSATSAAASEPTEPAAPPSVLGPLGSTELEIDTGEGAVQIGSGEVPRSVPTSFPLPADLVVQLASDTGVEAGFSGVSALGFAALVELYRAGLPAAGFDVRTESVRDTVATFEFVGPDGSGQVAISSAPGGVGHTVIVTFRP